jgi:transcriptional regulator with XRE-family HTH domain
MIHDRIRRARVLRGLSLEEVAQRLGDISKQALSKFEKGGAVPNSTRLLQLAKVLERQARVFFRADAVALAPLEFRKLAKMPKYRQEQVEEQMREHLERYIALERCFDAADVAVEATPTHFMPVSSVEAAEEAARKLRRLGHRR